MKDLLNKKIIVPILEFVRFPELSPKVANERYRYAEWESKEQ